MPHPSRPHLLEIIELPEGTASPEGATWINLSPVLGGAWCLEGNIPVPAGTMYEWGEYPGAFTAVQAAIDLALQQQVPLLYVEIDARRCDR
jgi:hypothetical protein